LELRLGRVTGTSDLDERIVYRDSERESGHYTERRWTELPDRYLQRRLERALFAERGVVSVLGGVGPTLDVELTAFEEVRAPTHFARAEVTARLHDQYAVAWEATFTVDQPVTPAQRGEDPADAVVDAFDAVLRVVVDRIATRTLIELARIHASSAPRAAHGMPVTPPLLRDDPPIAVPTARRVLDP
jgi:ABC-type uncharacterized transport system auxiliary subunit